MRFLKDIKGVIFDIDGVLLDSMRIWKDLGERYLKSRGKEPKEGLSDILFSMSMEEGAAYLRDHYLSDETSETIGEGLQGMLRDFYYYEVRTKEGAEELLETFEGKGIRMTAATSSPRTHVEKALERNGLLSHIEKIFTSAEVGSSKHSPEIYDAAAGFMGLRREEVCVIEDSLYALRTAADAGYFTVGVRDEEGESDRKGLEEAADIYIGDLSELMNKIE